MILNTQNLTTLFQQYDDAFKDGFARAEALWTSIATEIPSGGESNLYAFLGQFPRLREWLGDRVIKNLAAHDYTIINKSFESTVGVPKPKIDDDTYGVFSPLMAEMGYSAAMHPDELMFALALTGAVDLCYDGQPFFNANHPVKVDGAMTTTSNYDATGGGAMWMLLDTHRPLKPFIFQKRKDYNFQSFTKSDDEHVFMSDEFRYGVDGRMNVGFGLWQLAYASLNDLDATNYDAGVTAMLSQKSDEDKPLGVRPNLLVVGPSNRTAARDLIGLEKLSSGASNPHYKDLEWIVSPHMV